MKGASLFLLSIAFLCSTAVTQQATPQAPMSSRLDRKAVALPQGQDAQVTVLFSDDFSDYLDGSDGSPVWHVIKGDWQIAKGQYCQRNREEYDCGALLDLYLNESFSIELMFQLTDGKLGIGLFFSSASATSTDFAQMVRFEEGQSVLFGYFRAGEYIAEAVQKVQLLEDLSIHRLKLDVNREDNTYALFLDGQTIKSGVPLVYRAGYIGLQTSAGAICFDNIEITKTADSVSASPLHWITFAALSREGELLVPSLQMGTVHVYDRQAKYLRRIGTPARERGQLESPQGIAVLPNGNVVVSDIGLHRVHLFKSDGEWVGAVGGKGDGKAQFDEPAAVSSNERRIFVVDRNNNRVQVFDDSLQYLLQFGRIALDKPAAIAVDDSLIYVVNSGKPTVEIFAWDGVSAVWRRSLSYGAGEGKGIAAGGGYLYLSVGKEVRRYNTVDQLLSTFSARAIGGMYPWGIVSDGESIIIADHLGSRFVVTDLFLHDPKPTVTFLEPGRARITWTTLQPERCTLRLTQKDKISALSEATERTEHEFTLPNLPPSMVFQYQFSPSLVTLPSTQAKPYRYTFISRAATGGKHYWRFPLVVLIFANVIDETKWQSDWPPLPPLPEEEIERIKNQIRDGVRFYWVNSHMNFFLDVDFVVVTVPWNRGDLFDDRFWWHPPRRGNVETYLADAGKDAEDYAGVLYLACERIYDSELKRYVLAGQGGGFTNGVTAGYGYGISWWEVTKANHNAGNNWLFVHEFNHQLDDVFLVSGYPEYWFNHFSVSIGTVAKFGEHFDGNAYILRTVEDPWWFDLTHGSIGFTADRDGDGIPDDDPKLPLDEKRFGSSPSRRDTDDDGLTDLEEVLLSNWVVEGWGETSSASTLMPSPVDADIDNDGLIDSEDPYPLFPPKPEIKRGSPLIDGILQPGEWELLSTVRDSRVSAQIYTHWDESNLYLALETDRMLPCKIQLDADADGWFVGRDNYLLLFTPEDDRAVEVAVELFDASNVREWPQKNEQLASKIKPISSYSRQGSSYVLEVAIPKDSNTGVNLSVGEEIGLLFGIHCPFDSDDNKRYVVCFEPNKFYYVTLK